RLVHLGHMYRVYMVYKTIFGKHDMNYTFKTVCYNAHIFSIIIIPYLQQMWISLVQQPGGFSIKLTKVNFPINFYMFIDCHFPIIYIYIIKYVSAISSQVDENLTCGNLLSTKPNCDDSTNMIVLNASIYVNRFAYIHIFSLKNTRDWSKKGFPFQNITTIYFKADTAQAFNLLSLQRMSLYMFLHVNSIKGLFSFFAQRSL
ncbi:hypothetical protein ACJX0J_031875, partial [Zea mays]